MKKISECSASVKKVIAVANSLPENFSANADLSALENADKEKEEFFRAYKNLPNAFLENNLWIQKIIDGDVLASEDTCLELKNRMPTKLTIEEIKDLLENMWIQFTDDLIPTADNPSPQGGYTWLPRVRLEIQILWAKSTRQRLMKVIEENNAGRRSIEDELVKFSSLINDNGIYKFTALYPMNIFLDEQTDTKRIRFCAECKSFFWVRRLSANLENMVCEQCRTQVKQRKNLKNNSQEFNKQKRLKRYQEKGKTDYCDYCVYPFDRYGCTLVECSFQEKR